MRKRRNDDFEMQMCRWDVERASRFRAMVREYQDRRAVNELDFRLFHALVGKREKDNGDLLSYVFFDRALIEPAIQLGIRYARNKTGGSASWRPSFARRAPKSTVF